MILPLGVQVFGALGVVLQGGQGADERGAVGKDIQHGKPVVVKLEPVVQLHPPRQPLVVPGGEIDLMPCRSVRDALSRLPVPDGGVGDSGDPLSRKPPVLAFDAVNFPEYLLRRPLDPLVGGSGAAVQLQNPVGYPIIVHCPPAAGKRLVVSPVETPVYLPALRYLKWIDDIRPLAVLVMIWNIHKVLKELALIHIPPAIQPRLPDFRRKLLEGAHVLRLTFHQRHIVRAKSLDKCVILRVFVIGKPPVNKQPLEIPVAGAAGVQCVVGALRKVVDTTDAGVNGGQPVFQELPCLVGKPHIVFSALVLPQVPIVCAVPKPDRRPIGECKAFIRFVVLCDAVQHDQKRRNVVVEKLPKCFPGN